MTEILVTLVNLVKLGIRHKAQTMKNFKDVLTKKVIKELSGDNSRVLDLFENHDLWVVLDQEDGAGWYNFTTRDNDGEYFIKSENGYLVYFQERGVIAERQSFNDPKQAAKYFLRSIRSINGEKLNHQELD